jgi:uncharacterized membrane protein YgcG
VALAAWAAAAVATLALARGLPPESFYVGDPGVKLIAARNALARPLGPFEIPLPVIGFEPVPYVDPFFMVHGDHAHAITPELFPVLSAPLIAAFGLPGAYVLPALGLLLALAASARLAVALDSRRHPAVVVLTAFLATPLLFYGLEFWEHALAAGVAALATAMFVGPVFRLRALRRTTGALAEEVRLGVTPDLKVGPTFGAGLLFGLAVLLRPEALWFAVAVLACARLLPTPPRASAMFVAAAGIVVALLPLEIYNLLHFGSPIPPHIAGNPALVSGDWLPIRATLLSSWVFSAGTTSFWRVAPAILLAPFAFYTGAGAPPPARAYADASPRISGSSARHGRRRLSFSFFSGPGGPSSGGRAFLLAVALLDIALVVLTAPNDGGGQWGPRYLLLAYLPLALLAADAISYVASDFSRTAPLWKRAIHVAAIIAVVLGSAWIQRSAYKELRGAKLTYARLVDFVEREVPAGGYAVTDLWWLDQAAASLTDTRRFLYVATATAAANALQRLDREGEPGVTLVRSRVESEGPSEPWLERTCYKETSRVDIPERTLVAVRLLRSCDP